ncbi:TIGR00730 family Rossman fold protein [Pseudonocardiaceae bacterium YIM PH 21723]|nr:TIGR00730 family Rossman fold protein [Pseudonocardiaceae bacterium YIM PH 21723]
MRMGVFCGAASGHSERYVQAGRRLGTAMAQRGVELVYGAGSTGMMGAVAETVLAGGGMAIGVTPQEFITAEEVRLDLTELRVVDGMHARKATMAELADAFLILPGGIGTLDEFFEIWTWSALGMHDKPIALADVDGFFQPLLAMITHMVGEGFLREPARDRLLVDADPVRLLDRLAPVTSSAA